MCQTLSHPDVNAYDDWIFSDNQLLKAAFKVLTFWLSEGSAMFRIGGHESGDSPSDSEDPTELDHFFLILVAAQDKQGRQI